MFQEWELVLSLSVSLLCVFVHVFCACRKGGSLFIYSMAMIGYKVTDVFCITSGNHTTIEK